MLSDEEIIDAYNEPSKGQRFGSTLTSMGRWPAKHYRAIARAAYLKGLRDAAELIEAQRNRQEFLTISGIVKEIDARIADAEPPAAEGEQDGE